MEKMIQPEKIRNVHGRFGEWVTFQQHFVDTSRQWESKIQIQHGPAKFQRHLKTSKLINLPKKYNINKGEKVESGNLEVTVFNE